MDVQLIYILNPDDKWSLYYARLLATDHTMHNQTFNNDKAYSIGDVANSVVCSSEEIPLVNVALCDIIVFRFSFAICMPIEKILL